MKKEVISTLRTNSLVDAIDNPVLVLDNTGKVTFCNRAYKKLAYRDNGTKSELKDIPLLLSLELEKMIDSGNDHSRIEVSIGNRFFFTEISLIKITSKLAGLIAIFREVLEQRDTTDRRPPLNPLSEETIAVIESLFDGIYVTDGRGKTIMTNKAYERITGVARHEVEGRTMEALVSEGFFNESVTLRVLKTRQPQSIIQKIKRSGKVIMVTGNPIFNSNQEIILVVTNVRDVSELNKLRIELEKMENLQQEHQLETHPHLEDDVLKGKYVFRSRVMKPLIDLAIRLAKVDTSILLLGESGVGKEVIADLIHSNSSRENNPLHKISCAAIPSHLLESELFGYSPGAFTGAKKEGKAGVFEMADGGTLLLDEIGEMPLELQAKLLRVLQDKEITRVGDNVPIKVDVRILAATNRDLEEMVGKNLFRKDLFFRLNVVPFLIPPLRERLDGIPALTYFFLAKFNSKYQQNKTIEPQVIDLLKTYHWPGNVRELKNIVERIVVINQEELIRPRHLPERIKNRSKGIETSLIEDQPLKKMLGDFEKKIIAGAIKKHGTTRKAAAVLQVDQSTVVRKAKKYQIDLTSIAEK